MPPGFKDSPLAPGGKFDPLKIRLKFLSLFEAGVSLTRSEIQISHEIRLEAFRI